MLRATLIAALALMASPALAFEATLVYQGENHWVAQADNKPLVKLLAAAKAGAKHYTVELPTDNRRLAIERLDVLANLLAREAKAAIVIEELKTSSKANTITVATDSK